MKKYKNTDLAKMYKVSEKTVRNWIESAKKKNLNVELVNDGRRDYIADTPMNHEQISLLVNSGKKYKNKKYLKKITPLPSFYEIFNDSQIIDLITEIEVSRSIDFKYVYLQNGASFWSDYFTTAIKADGDNLPKNTVWTIDQSLKYINVLVEKYDFVNVVDIGVGNAFPAKSIIDLLKSKNKFNKYIGIDYSDEILQVAKENLTNWYGTNSNFEFHNRDITYQGIKDILFLNSQKQNSVNLVIFVGSTIENNNDSDFALNVIRSSIGPKDIFCIGRTLDTEILRSQVYFNKKSNDSNYRRESFYNVPNWLGLTEDLYEVERYFDIETNSRLVKLVLKYDVDINIKTEVIDRTIKLYSKDKITVYRHNHNPKLADVVRKLEEREFKCLFTITSRDKSYAFLINTLKKQS